MLWHLLNNKNTQFPKQIEQKNKIKKFAEKNEEMSYNEEANYSRLMIHYFTTMSFLRLSWGTLIFTLRHYLSPYTTRAKLIASNPSFFYL